MDRAPMKIRLNNNQLKFVALVTMTVDHAGMYLFPHAIWMRLIGRLAFPIFAYMIAEGCTHTRSMPRYLGVMAAFAAVHQLIFYFAEGSLRQGILVTFSLAIGLIFLIRLARERETPGARTLLVLGLVAVLFVARFLPEVLRNTDFDVDYGLYGVLLPVGIYLGKGKLQKLLFAAGLLALLALESVSLQWYALLALPLLWLYDGTRGKPGFKWLFYVYYPAHLVVLWLARRLFF